MQLDLPWPPLTSIIGHGLVRQRRCPALSTCVPHEGQFWWRCHFLWCVARRRTFKPLAKVLGLQVCASVRCWLQPFSRRFCQWPRRQRTLPKSTSLPGQLPSMYAGALNVWHVVAKRPFLQQVGCGWPWCCLAANCPALGPEVGQVETSSHRLKGDREFKWIGSCPGVFLPMVCFFARHSGSFSPGLPLLH